MSRMEMATDEEAQTAAAKLNGYQLGGRTLTVNEARPKPAYAAAASVVAVAGAAAVIANLAGKPAFLIRIPDQTGGRGPLVPKSPQSRPCPPALPGRAACITFFANGSPQSDPGVVPTP